MGIDSALLDLTERICHKIQMLTGRTNVWIAFQLTNLSVIVYFIWVALYFPNLPPYWRIAAALFSGGVLFALSQSVFKVSIDASREQRVPPRREGSEEPKTRSRRAPASCVLDAVDCAGLPAVGHLRHAALAGRPSRLLPGWSDGRGALPAGLRSTASLPRSGWRSWLVPSRVDVFVPNNLFPLRLKRCRGSNQKYGADARDQDQAVSRAR